MSSWNCIFCEPRTKNWTIFERREYHPNSQVCLCTSVSMLVLVLTFTRSSGLVTIRAFSASLQQYLFTFDPCHCVWQVLPTRRQSVLPARARRQSVLPPRPESIVPSRQISTVSPTRDSTQVHHDGLNEKVISRTGTRFT